MLLSADVARQVGEFLDRAASARSDDRDRRIGRRRRRADPALVALARHLHAAAVSHRRTFVRIARSPASCVSTSRRSGPRRKSARPNVEGAELGSRALTFRPGRLAAGDYSFDIGTAGSCTLVFQTVLPALLTAPGESRVRIMGGTHNHGVAAVRLPGAQFPAVARTHGREGAARPCELRVLSARWRRDPRAHHTRRRRLGALNLRERGALGARLRRGLCGGNSAPCRAARTCRSSAAGSAGRSEQLLLRALPNDVGPGKRAHDHARARATSRKSSPASARRACARKPWPKRRRMKRARILRRARRWASIWPISCCCRWLWAREAVFLATRVTPHLRSNAAVIERFTTRRVAVEQVTEGFLIRCGDSWTIA